jgi:hypothetical protein
VEKVREFLGLRNYYYKNWLVFIVGVMKERFLEFLGLKNEN